MKSLLEKIHSYDSDFNCLLDNPISDLMSKTAMCGNGQVEAGEDCDYGLLTKDTVCDPKTCKFVGDAAEKQTLPSKCPWSSPETGPVDECCEMATLEDGTKGFFQRPNSTPCDGGLGFCRNGFCESRDWQCRRAFGQNFTSAPEETYAINGGEAWSSGFCSYHPYSTAVEHYEFRTKRCLARDRACGSLICTDGTLELHVDVSRYSTVIKHHLSVNGHDERFVSAIQDSQLSGAPDPLLVADGISCGRFRVGFLFLSLTTHSCLPRAEMREAEMRSRRIVSRFFIPSFVRSIDRYFFHCTAIFFYLCTSQNSINRLCITITRLA
ncbi:ADAM metallopeptidase domain 28 [Cichlidogyrus casuarinus]|uniref:ADAM metallopeptidase domain 28 n=1 Tax=Cichlidogyrus casuarinus TaxID=1844966 RepID=A0ABD2QJJ0_9PLAT